MNLIGRASTGAVIVEMTAEEWHIVNEARPMDVGYAPEDRARWYKRFRIDLQHLDLSPRVHNAIMRSIIDARQPGIEEQVFTRDGRYLPFEQWVLIAKGRKALLLEMRNLGKGGVSEILQAIDNYLADCASEAAE